LLELEHPAPPVAARPAKTSTTRRAAVRVARPLSHRQLLRLAYEVAVTSNDASTQNGAFLARRGVPILETAATNGLPDGVSATPERMQHPLKYTAFEHAERNAIYRAARQGIATEGLTLVCPWAACTDCARAIIQSGVKELVTQHPDAGASADPGSADWNASIQEAMRMLAEAGVKVTYYDGPIGGIAVRRHGEVIHP
jgi:dCMP deaminase